MPLVRFEVRNEYGLGAQELYREANKDDPKAILDGVAVSGLVGILRQLGDLAEFAGEVFHDLQEQVMATTARSKKMMVRVQHIEAGLTPLEKAIMAQTSHIHFAYTTGSNWHPNIRSGQNHLIDSDWPQFILNSYEECRDPPSLHLLDRFDTGGPGACLRRYSDSSLFKRSLASSELVNADKVQREKWTRKSKKKGSRRRNGEVSRAVSTSRRNGRMQFASPNIYGQNSDAENISTFHMSSKSELGDQSTSFGENPAADTISTFHMSSKSELGDSSFDSRNHSGYIECVFDVCSPMRHEDQEHNELSTSRLKMHHSGTIGAILPDEQKTGAYDDLTHGSLQERSVPNSSSVTWDEKTEIVKPTSQQSDNIVEDQGKASELLPVSSDVSELESEAATLRNDEKTEIVKPTSQQSDNIVEDQGKASELLPVSSDLSELESEAATLRNDEKTEIVKPTSQQSDNIVEDQGKASELLPVSSDLSELESEAATLRNDEKTEIVKPMSQQSDNIVEDQGKASELLPVSSDLSELESEAATLRNESNDEKTEIVKPTSQQSDNIVEDQGKASELLPVSSDLSELESEAATLRNDEKTEIVKPMSQQSDNIVEDQGKASELLPVSSDLSELESEAATFRYDEKTEIVKPTSQQSDNIVEDQGKASELLPVGSDLSELESEAATLRYDEKTEIVKPTSQQSDNIVEDQGKASELLPVSSDLSELESEAATLRNDEKTEIVKPTSQQSDNIVEDQGKASELLPVSSDLSELESEAATLRNVGLEDILCDDENILESLSEGNQFDEVGSEPDDYMDALNTMESETETDFECQTKREVELPLAKFKNNEVECGTGAMHEMTAQNSESSDVESPTSSYSSSNKQMSQNFSNSVLSEDLKYAQPPQITGMSSNQDVSVDTDSCESTDLLDVSRVNGFESVIIDLSSSGSSIPSSQAPLGIKITSIMSESPESPDEISGLHPIIFWTNGGLLGLEPSKPPDFCMLNVESKNSMDGNKDDAHDLPSDSVMPKSHSNGSVRKLDTSVKTPEHIEKNFNSEGERGRSPDIVCSNDLSSDQFVRRTGYMVRTSDHTECSTSCTDKQDDGMSKWNPMELLSAVSETKLQKSKDSSHSSSISNAQGCGLTETTVITSGAKLPFIPDVKGPSIEADQENSESSSRMFGLSHRLLVNGFRRKVSLVNVETSEPPGSMKTGVMKLQEPHCIDQKGQNRVVHQTSPDQNPKEQLVHGSPANSLSSSPPLEHMKISFQPITGFETSLLKLRFPDGHHFHESIKDVTFPSFQLLPELSIPLRDIGSESEDDTFCRSSPYMSEELMSQHSESNSEQWESSETPGSKDHEIYDAFRRVSSAESILSSFELEGITHDSIYLDCDFKSLDTENGLKPFYSGPSLDLPTFDAVNPLTSQQGRKTDSGPKDHQDSVLQYPEEPTPHAPPLHPLQWWAMKPDFTVAKNEQDAISKAVNHPNDLQVPGATPQQPKPASPKQPHIEATAHTPKRKDDQQKLNGHIEANQAANGKEMDEREDLLHQIRTKSFSLRHTVPTRPTFTPCPTTNVKMTAILEKANAIRQAFVGSDEGGDDENWSDG